MSPGISDLQNDYKQFLLSKLTTAVQKLRNDLENAALQVDFCRRIEMLIFYGLKIRTFKWKSESNDIWSLLKEISSKHIVEDIMLLKSVQTDIGRIRAWIRVTINESTLQSYIQLLTDKKLTKKYYESRAVFNDPALVTSIIELITVITESSCKVIFNCDSFDFEVAPSATELSQFDPIPSNSGKTSDVSSAINIHEQTTGDSISIQASLDSTLEHKLVEVDSEVVQTVACDSSSNEPVSEPVSQSETELQNEPDPAALVSPVSLVVTTEPDVASFQSFKTVPVPEAAPVSVKSEDASHVSLLSDTNGTPTTGTDVEFVSEDQSTPIQHLKVKRVSPEALLSSPERCPIAEEAGHPINDSISLPISNQSTVNPEVLLSSPERCPIAEEAEHPIDDDISLPVSDQSTPRQMIISDQVELQMPMESRSPNSGIVNSVPLLDGVISEHLLSIDQHLIKKSASDSQLHLHVEQADSANITSISLTSLNDQVLSDDLKISRDHDGSQDPKQPELEVALSQSVEGVINSEEGLVTEQADKSPEDSPTQTIFPTDLFTSSPIKSDAQLDNESTSTACDLLPGTPKDKRICDEEIYDLRQQMGNSLHISRDDVYGSEMLAQKVDPGFEDPYEDVSSAKSLSSSSHNSAFSESENNILQLLEAGTEQQEEVTIPIQDNSEPPHESNSLGSSLYRLFSRGGPELRQSKSENLSNLAEIHSAVVDDVPVSEEEQLSTRSYLVGATRATASYTYESANQWLELSKDMWWWLQKRVIKEHECQHPTPPQSDQMNGSPNSSLLDICTEQCACCNAIVIDYCNSDMYDPDTVIPVSKSCPPFSNVVQHMNSPRSPRISRHPISTDSNDYFNIDILQNPTPTLESLDKAIELQKARTQNTIDESGKKREMDILVKLRKKKHDIQNSNSDSSSEAIDTAINILGHTLVKSSELSGYCSRCGGAIYRRIKTAYCCSACTIILHKACINDVSRRCSLANKDTLTLLTNIAPPHGLHDQNYCCYDCGTEISYSSTKVHACDYSGRYYCQECHKKTLNLVPARIIHNWDFRPRQVALQSQEIISYLMDKEYLNIERLNPQLFDTVSVMGELRNLREKVVLYKAHFVQCSRAMREGLFLKLKTRQHFIDTSKLYTIRDLVDAQSGGLLPELQTVVSDYEKHYEDCETCYNQKFMCAVCESPPLINPFIDLYSIAQCSQCHGVLHRPCFNRSDNCPYCSASLINEM